MAAAPAPAEDPTPSTSPDLPPVKRKMNGPSSLATSGADWSSLPGDLVRRIADSFLATNDLDHYMYLRAVCPSWRAGTDDPRNNTADPRFQPRRWIILDDVFRPEGDLLLLNTDTGRFLRKKLPLLQEYHAVATTPRGFFVLADRSPPHAARLFNPLTGVLTRFRAPMPPEARVAYVCTKDAQFTILLLGDSSQKIYSATSDSESFAGKDYQQGVYSFVLKAIIGGAHSHISASLFVDVVAQLFDWMRSLHPDPVEFISSDCFVVGLDSDMVLVIKHFRTPFVFKVNTEKCHMEDVGDIGRFAIFIGHHKCLSVDTNKFPGIEANCMYYTESWGLSARICKYSFKDSREEIISEAAEFLKQDKQFVLVADRPFTIIHLLCSYTINIPDSQLAFQQMS